MKLHRIVTHHEALCSYVLKISIWPPLPWKRNRKKAGKLKMLQTCWNFTGILNGMWGIGFQCQNFQNGRRCHGNETGKSRKTLKLLQTWWNFTEILNGMWGLLWKAYLEVVGDFCACACTITTLVLILIFFFRKFFCPCEISITTRDTKFKLGIHIH